MRPRLAILIPTYDRAARLDAALAALADDLGARTDVPILVSDNASPDETGRVLLAWRERLPSLRVHRQPENVGMLANLRWLVEHAPDADYVWLLGDDDRIVPGAIGTISDLLAREQPVWLHLPHRFENAAGLGASSPCPAAVERLGGAGELYDRYHHWLTFISAQVVDRDALQRAIAEPCHNPFAPFVWYARAALHAPCVVADRLLVVGSDDVSWRDQQAEFMTRAYVALYDDVLHRVVDRASFARSLDRLYGTPHGLDFWRRMPLDELVATVERFPWSGVLRGFLWTLARDQGRRDALHALERAGRVAGCEERAIGLVASGEERFAGGDVAAAELAFEEAVALLPTHARAWNDLGVVRHALGRVGAAEALHVALELDPAYADARLNLELVAG